MVSTECQPPGTGIEARGYRPGREMIQDRARPNAQHGWFRELRIPIVEQAVVSELNDDDTPGM